MKVKYITCILSILFFGCERDSQYYKLSDVDFKLVQIDDSSSFTNEFQYKDDSNNCVVLMKFKVDYAIGKFGWHNDSEPGRKGIITQIKSAAIVNTNNQSFDVKGFNFDAQSLIFESSVLAKWSQHLNLNTYKNLEDLQNSINEKERKSVGGGIASPILFSIPCALKDSPNYFKMYFENGDSLVKRFDLSKEIAVPIKIK